MQKSKFKIDHMDCNAEEQMIRMALGDCATIASLEFDIPNRFLTIYHDGDLNDIQTKISALNFSDTLISTEKSQIEVPVESASDQKLLWIALAINLGFFFIEGIAGWFSDSVSLMADSLDMFADAFVYGISLYALTGTLFMKKKVAAIGGYLQMLLAIWGFAEVIRRFVNPHEEPIGLVMIIVAIAALIANTATLRILNRSKSGEVTIKASQICTSNDVIANAGVILAGALVWVSHSKMPDLIVGIVIFILILRASVRMIKLSK